MILPLTGAAASLSVSLPEDLTGTIGSSWVSMRLARPRGALALWRCRLGLATDCDPKSVDGVYRYERYQDDILLEGKLQRDGQLTLTEYSVPGQLSTGRFIGTLTAAGYRGQWESTDGKRTVDFDLHVQGKAAPLNGQQLQTIDNENQERALQAIEQKDYARAIYWLQIARLRGSMLDTEPLQAAFTAVLAGQTHEPRGSLKSGHVGSVQKRPR